MEPPRYQLRVDQTQAFRQLLTGACDLYCNALNSKGSRLDTLLQLFQWIVLSRMDDMHLNIDYIGRVKGESEGGWYAKD